MRHSISRFSFYISALLLFVSLSAWADVQIDIADPSWNFIIENNINQNSDVQIQPSERAFSQKIQPLLAAKKYAEVEQAFAARPLAEDSPALRLLRGQVLLSIKKYPEAEAALLSALSAVPNLALAHRSVAMVYLQQKNYSKARFHLAKAVSLGVADAQVYGQLAYVNLQSQFPASAIAGYQQALLLEPENTQWVRGLIYALTKSYALDQAQGLVDELITQAPSPVVEDWLLRSQIALARNNKKQSLAGLEVALRLGDKSAKNILLAAKLHLDSGNSERGLALLNANFNELLQQEKRESLQTLDQTLAWLIAQDQWANAEKFLVKFESVKNSLTPQQTENLLLYKARVSLHKGNTPAAERALVSAIKSNPAQGEVLLLLGSLYRDQNNLEQAQMYLVRAEAMPAYKERAMLARAQLEINRQNYVEALGLLHKLLKLNPSRTDLIANIRNLEHLVRNQG